MTGGHRKQGPARDELKYLRDTPAVFREIADVLLILDSGEELPTHRWRCLLSHETYFLGRCHDKEHAMAGAQAGALPEVGGVLLPL